MTNQLDPIGADGVALRRSDVAEDGSKIEPERNLRAGILGTILFLEQIASEDTSMEFRQNARTQASTLRGMLRASRGGRGDVIENAIAEEVRRLLEGHKALPAPRQRMRLANDHGEVIDV